jgi:ketosteroid isomerase-like protein
MSEALRLLDLGFRLIYREDRLDDALRGLDDDFEWVATDHPDGAVYHGPDGVAEFFHDWRASWDDLGLDWKLEPIDDERVLAIIDMRGRGRGSGVPVEMHFGQIWTYRDGRFTRMVMYTDADSARRAAASAGS